jgi:hypothetical protein
MTAAPDHFELPRLRAVIRHSIPRIVECSLIPVSLFYIFLWIDGVWAGILAVLFWSYTALIRRLLLRQRIPGLLLLATFGATGKTVLAMASHSAFVYFLQPSLMTAAVGAAFLLSIPAGRPAAEHLAHDFLPMPRTPDEAAAMRPLMVRVTIVWAIVNLIQAGGAIGLLLTQPVATFVAAKTALCWLMTGLGAAVTVVFFKRMAAKAAPEPVAVTAIIPAATTSPTVAA